MKDLAAKLGVALQPGEIDMGADDLTNTLIQRAKEAGKSEADISAALE